ncbi:hypothetical protein, conserved [Plasmodium gonderi]|uniref:Uncharacterized protein n=1 Tax=Plasmodium gonderi TaxID=77519 RepID=A0A1Y1JMQ1_PLAGO|nr:hypothetical protein, conserved [Plasmodium gonderi]GAW83759.1 hypothetical protein, conserved [Plasmodium gonderi]
MKLNCKEKKALLENLTNRMLKIEHAIGSIKFYEKGNNAKKFPDDEKFANDEKTFENGDSEYLNRSHASSDNGKNDDIEPSREDEKDFNEIKSRLENVSQDLTGIHKDEIIETIKKHGHQNSMAVHICTIKLILQQIAKEFLHDIYNQYNEFYIYIHSNSILDVYNTFEYKRNIILSHLDFMKSYSNQIQKIVELKEHINSHKMSETELYLERLNKIEQKNEVLFSRISSLNSCMEDVAYKYSLMLQAASLIISRQKTNIS